MLMIQPPLDMGFDAYRHAIVHAQRLSDETSTSEPKEAMANARMSFANMIASFENTLESGHGLIRTLKEVAENTPYHSLWQLSDVWQKRIRPPQKLNPDRDVLTWGIENFDDDGRGAIIIESALKVDDQVHEWHRKVDTMIKRSVEAHNKRQKIVLPQNEVEMTKMARSFAKKHKKVLSELARI
jgi:hypothetical protein